MALMFGALQHILLQLTTAQQVRSTGSAGGLRLSYVAWVTAGPYLASRQRWTPMALGATTTAD